MVLSYQIVEDFLTAEQCDALMAMAKPRLQPSEGWSVGSGRSERTTYRESDQTWFVLNENPLVSQIEQQIATDSEIPVENGEGLQVVRYLKGGHYYTHHDAFDPNYEGNRSVLLRGGQRIKTYLIYLNDLAQDGSDGGATYFPAIDLRVYPKKGRALVWWNVWKELRTGEYRMEPQASHSGEDLLSDTKEKWILTKWLRERPFH